MHVLYIQPALFNGHLSAAMKCLVHVSFPAFKAVTHNHFYLSCLHPYILIICLYHCISLLGFRKKILWSGWSKQWEFIFSKFCQKSRSKIKFKIKVLESLFSSEASFWIADGCLLAVPSVCAHPWCPFVYPDFLKGYQSDWIRAHLNGFILN